MQSASDLLTEESAVQALSLDIADINWLVSTGQLTPITVREQRLYLWSQLEELVAVYYAQQTKR
jgi:hypothetical protein